MTEVNLSIVVRCYNEEKHIQRLLEGIYSQSRKDIEVIVVDSGSTDRTLAIVSQYPTSLIQILPENFSFGHPKYGFDLLTQIFFIPNLMKDSSVIVATSSCSSTIFTFSTILAIVVSISPPFDPNINTLSVFVNSSIDNVMHII